MKNRMLRQIHACLFASLIFLSGCSSGPRITTVLDVPESADAPYENILVIALLPKFESRRRLERAIADELSGPGIIAVASSSRMQTTTPLTRKVFLSMIEELGSDAVLVTKLIDVESKPVMKDSASPEVSYKVRSVDFYQSYYYPGYYYNVFEVDREEYIEPQTLGSDNEFVLGTELYSVSTRKPVWAIESDAKVEISGTLRENYMLFLDEADAIVKRMSRNGLIAGPR